MSSVTVDEKGVIDDVYEIKVQYKDNNDELKTCKFFIPVKQ